MSTTTLDPLERDSSTRLGTFDMTDSDGGRGTYRPIPRGTRGAVATGHLLPTMAAYDMLRQGGNAADAGVAAGLCHCVVEHDRASLGGVAPIIYFEANSGTVHTISGLGRWPKASTYITADDLARARLRFCGTQPRRERLSISGGQVRLGNLASQPDDVPFTAGPL